MVEYQLKLHSWFMKRCYSVLWITHLSFKHHVWPNAPSLYWMFVQRHNYCCEPCSLLFSSFLHCQRSENRAACSFLWGSFSSSQKTATLVKLFPAPETHPPNCVLCEAVLSFCWRVSKMLWQNPEDVFQVLPGSSRFFQVKRVRGSGSQRCLRGSALCRPAGEVDWLSGSERLPVRQSAVDLISAADLMVFRSKHFRVKVCKVFEMSRS